MIIMSELLLTGEGESKGGEERSTKVSSKW
jgi:hypothetical protein